MTIALRLSGWRLVLVAALASSMGMPAGAQAIYRCGPDGRSYSHQPCAEGRRVKADDARTPADRREAEAATGRAAAAAAALERQRRHDERVAARTGPAGLRTAPDNRRDNPSAATPKSSKASTKTLRKATQQARDKTPRQRPKTAA